MSAGAVPSLEPRIDDPLFLEEVRGQMMRFAMQQLGERSAAEDAVQDALVGALRNRGSFQGRAARRSWMFAALKNKIVDTVRRKSRASQLEHPVSWDNLEVTAIPFDGRGHWRSEFRPRAWAQPDESLEDARFWRVFGACLDHLPVAGVGRGECACASAQGPAGVSRVPAEGLVLRGNVLMLNCERATIRISQAQDRLLTRAERYSLALYAFSVTLAGPSASRCRCYAARPAALPKPIRATTIANRKSTESLP